MDFDHSGSPTFTQTSITGASNQSIILLPESSSYPEGLQANPTAFQFRNGTYYVRGRADVLVSASGGTGSTDTRKGVFAAGFNIPIPPAKKNYSYNVSFMQIAEPGGDLSPTTSDYWTIYLSSNPNGVTYFASNLKYNGSPDGETQDTYLDTTALPDGSTSICGFIKDFPRGHINTSACLPLVIDNTPPAMPVIKDINGGILAPAGDGVVYTSSSAIQVEGTDAGSGIASMTVQGINVSYSSTSYITGVSTDATVRFPDSPAVLANGSYTATVVDLAGNVQIASFTVVTLDTASATLSLRDPYGGAIGSSILSSTAVVIVSSGASSGISSVNITNGAGYSSTAAWTVPASSAVFGSHFFSAGGTYTITARTASGGVLARTLSVAYVAPAMTLISSASSASGGITTVSALCTDSLKLYVTGPGGSPVDPLCQWMTLNAPGTLLCPSGAEPPPGSPGCGTSPFCERSLMDPAPASVSYGVSNTAASQYQQGFGVSAYLFLHGGSSLDAQVSTTGVRGIFYPGDSIGGSVTFPQACPSTTTAGGSSNGTVTMTAPFTGANYSVPSPSFLESLIAKIKALVVAVRAKIGFSDAVFVTSGTVTFALQNNSPVAVDTTTLSIYLWTGTDWSSATVTSQSVSVSGSTITISGSVLQSGIFAAMFNVPDSSAPATTFSIQGSSYSFDNTSFVSTYSYVVLTATDPVVNGFAAGVATTYYRLDSTASTDPWSVYAASVPLALGPHVLQYYSVDWAKNAEAIHYSTFVVTAGTVFKDVGNLSVGGNFLAGFLGNGYTAEIQSQAQNSYTLLVSSPNLGNMLDVTNVGNIGLGGVSNPQATLDVGGQGTNGEIALQLRSGNSTMTALSGQLAFGYNGDVAMSHAIRTGHSTTSIGNRMDFYVWNPAAGSTATAANLDVASLQVSTTAGGGASLHIHPTADVGDAEVEVSNGLTTGGGTVLRALAIISSSRELKSDIRYLKNKEYAQAYRDVMGLKPAQFRYKVRGPDGRLVEDHARPLDKGLILEDAPESVKDGRAVLLNERIVNLEMALKFAISRMESLQKRLETLKAEGAP